MAKNQIKHKGGRDKRFPNSRLTQAELERFNRLRGDMSASDFIVKMIDVYEKHIVFFNLNQN